MGGGRIGTVAEIWRFPIKSFAGERLDAVRLEPYGVRGDRIHAFVDRDKSGWERYVTARSFPPMLGYKAELADGPDGDGEFPPVIVRTPDGRRVYADESLLEEVRKLTGRSFAMESYAPSEPLMAVDLESVLVITTAMLKKLEDLLGRKVDARRFRANLLIDTDDERFEDGALPGRRLRIGEAVLQVNQPCERCSMITVDPDTLQRDPSILRKVNEALGLQFGVYATVVKPGTIREGDPAADAESP